jgi:hypothetical protein
MATEQLVTAGPGIEIVGVSFSTPRKKEKPRSCWDCEIDRDLCEALCPHRRSVSFE